MPSTPPVIEARGVAKRFGSVAALASLDFAVGHGITGLLGSNGAGKTTLISLMLGLQDRDAGNLEVLGIDPEESGPELRARVGYSPEHHNLPEDVQAADLVQHIARLHGLPHRAATERASDALWQVGLGEERFRPIGTMSTGQRQRVKLAQAIAHDPALVVLDEPTDGLDPVQREDMLELIRRIGTTYGIDIMLSSHLLEEVERICDNVVILSEGVVSRAGEIGALRGQSTGFVVEVDRDHDTLAARLSEAGLDVRVEGTAVLVDGGGRAPDDHTVPDAVRDAIADMDLGLRRLAPRRARLEQVFLESQR